jgi:hypothetical protein
VRERSSSNPVSSPKLHSLTVAAPHNAIALCDAVGESAISWRSASSCIPSACTLQRKARHPAPQWRSHAAVMHSGMI